MNFKQIILFHPDIFFWKKISFFCPWEDKRTFVKNGTFSGGEGISGLSLQHKLLTDPHSGPVEEPRINDLQKHLPQGTHHCFMAVLLPELWVLKQGIHNTCLYTKNFPSPPSPALSIPLAILGPAFPQVTLAPAKSNGKSWNVVTDYFSLI